LYPLRLTQRRGAGPIEATAETLDQNSNMPKSIMLYFPLIISPL
jgi:hypothetical protein